MDRDSKVSGAVPLELEGDWVQIETGTHLYARVVNGELVVPYCFAGNQHLTGAFAGWRKAGGYWYARFGWFQAHIAGYTLLIHEAPDRLRGAWWLDDKAADSPQAGMSSGVQWRLQRQPTRPLPLWASRFVEDVSHDRTALDAMLLRSVGNRPPTHRAAS